jgi:transposase
MTSEQIELIIDMYRGECSFSQIAAAVGKSDNTVKHWVRQNREVFGLKKRRNRGEKMGSLSYAVEEENTWNLRRGVELIKRKWPCPDTKSC